MIIMKEFWQKVENSPLTHCAKKWFGLDRSKMTLLEVVHENIIASELLVTKGIYRKSTLVKYVTTEKHLKASVNWRNLGRDIFLKDLRIGFISDFEYYMEAEKGLSINSAGRMVKNLKKIIRDCVNKDWLDKDPFSNFKVKHIDPKVPHLSAEELERMENKHFDVKRLELVKDIFLFSCYTGFAYIDVATLTGEHLHKEFDNHNWLCKPRQKTGVDERVPIFPKAQIILDKYAYLRISKKDNLLPVITNQKLNAYLKEIAIICDIKIKLTFHVARHTFASTVTLERGIPIDSVSKMLGHRSIKTTQVYAKISDKKISDDTKGFYETSV